MNLFETILSASVYTEILKLKPMDSLELCAGGGGQALGLEHAGFQHRGLVEIDAHACATLRANRPNWQVFEQDLELFDPRPFAGIDLIAGGLPCPPFSIAGKQLGPRDERNLFPAALRVIDVVRPQAVMIENVRGFLDPVFADYRETLRDSLLHLGYSCDWRLLNAKDFGVSQSRPRVVIVALRSDAWPYFSWPESGASEPPTVGELLYEDMCASKWAGARNWRRQANAIAPTIVGGSKKHGGPDLGPTRARQAWASLSVDGSGIADFPPVRDFEGMPKLTVPMVAKLQGFPSDWAFSGRKTNAYRQVGNAFPPPVAKAVGVQIATCLKAAALREAS